MTDTVQLALIAAVPSVVAAVLGYMNNRLARKGDERGELVKNSVVDTNKVVAETKVAVAKSAEVVQNLEVHTNSMKDSLVKITGEAEFAKGKLEGQQANVGPTGPAGPAGDAGIRGDTGPRGQAGPANV